MGETIAGWLQAVGIRTRMRTMERGAFMTSWREKKLHGVLLTISGVSGNAATKARVLRHHVHARSMSAGYQASSGMTQRGRAPEATRWILSKPLR